MLAPAIVLPWRLNRRPRFTSVARSGKRSMIWPTCFVKWKRKAQVPENPKKSFKSSAKGNGREKSQKAQKNGFSIRSYPRQGAYPSVSFFHSCSKFWLFYSHRLHLKMHHLVCADHV